MSGRKDTTILTFIDLKHFSGSYIISAFTSNFYTLFLTFGIMSGAAQSFVFVGGASVIYSYFKEIRGLATSKYHKIFVIISLK